VYVPVSDGASVKEGGVQASKVRNIEFLCNEPGYAVYAVGPGEYHMFTAENSGDPRIARMRIAHWSSSDALSWKRQATIVETTGEPMEVTGRAYTSIWQPTPVFNEAEKRWDLFGRDGQGEARSGTINVTCISS
jgi:hypothetical protein